jgi:hypothetical protein
LLSRFTVAVGENGHPASAPAVRQVYSLACWRVAGGAGQIMTASKFIAVVRPDFAIIERLGIEARWCVWKLKDRGEGQKPGKVPSNGRHNLDTNKPDDWLPSLKEAQTL